MHRSAKLFNHQGFTLPNMCEIFPPWKYQSILFDLRQCLMQTLPKAYLRENSQRCTQCIPNTSMA